MAEKEKKRVINKIKLHSKKKENLDEREVEFIFHAPEVREVYLAGEFNHWDTHSLLMKKDKDGVWKAKIKLPPGRYEYKLSADNAWVEYIPGAELVPNPFGTQNFIIWVN